MARQYTGTAGRIETAQVGVYLADANPDLSGGDALIDQALSLPQSWTGDLDRCRAVGVPEDVPFATRPALARQMLSRALDAGIAGAWLTGDEVYGNDPRGRAEATSRGLGSVLAVAKDHRITTGIGPRRAIDLAVRLPGRCWQRLSAGPDAKGPRRYDWALVETTDPAVPAAAGPQGLLIRRSISSGAYAFYRTHAPHPVPRGELVRVPGPDGTSRKASPAARNSPPRRPPGPRLDVLAPLDPAGHARPRVPVRDDRHPARRTRDPP